MPRTPQWAFIMSLTVENLIHFLETRYPLSLAENWDNVGLLVGDPGLPLRRVMACLTVTPESCREAIEQQADLIVTHHPFPFQPLRQITSATTDGTMLWQLIRAGIAVYSSHTAFDSASTGINRQIAEMLDLANVTTLYPQNDERSTGQGTGRVGMLPQPVPLVTLVENVARGFRVKVIPFVGEPDRLVQRVAVGCGAAGAFLQQVLVQKADVFLVGEAKFHQYLEASANGVALILPGHYASERFAVEQMAADIADHFRDCDESLTIWPSRCESDPLRFFLAPADDTTAR